MNKQALERFITWIRERHQIYLRRKAGLPKPWSDNEILRSNYFTNVYRELDKTTIWCKENVRDPLRDSPDVIFAIIAFRWFNWIPTGRILVGANLLRKWNLDSAIKFLGKLKEQGEQVFTGAFNISNSGSTKPKLNRVCEDYLQPVWDLRADVAVAFNRITTLKEAHRYLSKFPGLGGSGFMAGQVVCDLKYTKWLEGAADWWSWCSPGPGSIKGLNILLDRPEDGSPPKNFLEEVNNLRAIVAKALPKYPPLHAQDMQSCLCEDFKMERILRGERAKRRYPGAAD